MSEPWRPAGYARHILELPLRFFEMRRVGEILSRVNDAAKVREALKDTTLTAMVDGAQVLLLLVLLWSYDAPLAAVATAFVPLLLTSVAPHHPEFAAAAHLVEDVSGVETVNAFGVERAEEAESRLVDFTRSTFSLQKLSTSMSGLGMFVTRSTRAFARRRTRLFPAPRAGFQLPPCCSSRFRSRPRWHPSSSNRTRREPRFGAGRMPSKQRQ